MNKFDLIEFANNPKEWKNRKIKMMKQIERLQEVSNYLNKRIKTNFKDFSIKEFMRLNGAKEIQIKMIGNNNVSYSFRLNVNFELKKYELDFSKKDIKKKLIDLYGDLNIHIGNSMMLIHDTDLFIQKLNFKTLNPDYKHIKEVETLKDVKEKYSYYEPEFNEIYLDKNFLREEEEEIRKIGYSGKLFTKEFAFFILVLRHKNNKHFKNIFYGKSDFINRLPDINNIGDLETMAGIFINSVVTKRTHNIIRKKRVNKKK